MSRGTDTFKAADFHWVPSLASPGGQITQLVSLRLRSLSLHPHFWYVWWGSFIPPHCSHTISHVVWVGHFLPLKKAKPRPLQKQPACRTPKLTECEREGLIHTRWATAIALLSQAKHRAEDRTILFFPPSPSPSSSGHFKTLEKYSEEHAPNFKPILFGLSCLPCNVLSSLSK